MNYLLLAGLIVALLALGWVAWRYLRLHRRLDAYAVTIRRAAEGTDLPADVPGLEEFSNAVNGLSAAFNTQLSSVEAERAKLASVLEQMTDGVLIADADGQVTFMNPAAGRIFGAQAGRRVAEVLRQYQLVEAWQRCCETGEAQSETVELPARRQFLQLFALPDRQTGGSLLLVQDLTRVRRLETVRRDFISNISHELRTPLASLKALTETLRDGALDDPQAAPRFLGRIEIEVDALTQMAQELLELTRIESGQVPLELAAVDPARLLHSAAERMRMQAERAGLELTVEAAAGLSTVRGDTARLEQVLVNLIHNAVKFTGPGGAVILSAENDGEFVRFAVKDTGAGIPEDDLERVFERFYKSDRARSGGGTGLGLSIARHIVEAHGGKIWVESVEGRGSAFFFTIPLF
ncbi:MAG: two-component system OmpR family phosphate regulon sensor histidine kinase PhoR [Anaerolineaceae bacterium]|nr:MAG: two-component system OmpR family phosphate regulon sensor histidine kinase PhoR [Anaerolineaceae bacterium]